MKNLEMKRQNYASGTPWEPIVGYSRAVRKGQFIFVSGTTATNDDGTIVGISDPYLQTTQTIKNIEKALKNLGAELSDVVRTRIFVTYISDWEHIAKAHREAFGNILPATSMMEVGRFINPDMLVEIEAEAIVSE